MFLIVSCNCYKNLKESIKFPSKLFNAIAEDVAGVTAIINSRESPGIIKED